MVYIKLQLIETYTFAMIIAHPLSHQKYNTINDF
jgi:hypothetical protein